MEEKIIVKRPPKSPGLAGVLSFFFPFGTGALYNGQQKKALVFFLTFAGLVTLQTSGQGQPFLGLCLAAFYFYQIIEAVQTAQRINRRALVGEVTEDFMEDEFPDIVKTGSIFWGAFLMLIGGILLLANFDVISYNTLFDFWPLIIIVIGLKLVTEYFGQKNEESNG